VKRADVKLLAQIVFSAVLLSMCAWIILSGRYPDDYAKWAFGMAGVIIGYWLK